MLGADARVTAVGPLQAGPEQAVLLLTLARSPTQLVLKVASGHAVPAVDFERTAAVSALAQADW